MKWDDNESIVYSREATEEDLKSVRDDFREVRSISGKLLRVEFIPESGSELMIDHINNLINRRGDYAKGKRYV